MDGIDNIRGTVTITTGAGSADGDLSSFVVAASPRLVVRLVASAGLYWKSGIGAQTATSSDNYLPAGGNILVKLGSKHNHIAAIQESAAGKLGISILYQD